MSHAHKHPTRGFGIMETFLAKKRASLANRLIETNHREGRILDIGCGSFPHFLLSTKFKEKYGVDLVVHSRAFIDKSIKLKKMNIEKEKIPFSNNYFDVVVMLAVFEHINSIEVVRLLREAHRVLKKSGMLIITTPSPWSPALLWILSRINIISKVEIDDHKSSFKSDEINNFITEAGFDKKNISNGYFEASFNMWFCARK